MNRSRLFGGLTLVVLGLLFLLDSTGVQEFHTLIRTYWPVILIVIGVGMLARRTGVAPPAPAPAAGPEVESLRHSSVFGDLHVGVTSPAFSGGSASSVFGDMTIDLSGAGLREGHSLLRLSGVFGSVHVRVPPGMEYTASLQTVFGDLEAGGQRQEGFSPRLQYQTAGYARAPRTLMIAASQVFGDVTIHS